MYFLWKNGDLPMSCLSTNRNGEPKKKKKTAPLSRLKPGKTFVDRPLRASGDKCWDLWKRFTLFFFWQEWNGVDIKRGKNLEEMENLLTSFIIIHYPSSPSSSSSSSSCQILKDTLKIINALWGVDPEEVLEAFQQINQSDVQVTFIRFKQIHDGSI